MDRDWECRPVQVPARIRQSVAWPMGSLIWRPFNILTGTGLRTCSSMGTSCRPDIQIATNPDLGARTRMRVYGRPSRRANRPCSGLAHRIRFAGQGRLIDPKFGCSTTRPPAEIRSPSFSSTSGDAQIALR
jgi:hypothetical protein